MHIPVISNYCKKYRNRRLRSIMRGYEILKQQDQLDLIVNLKEQITNSSLNLPKDKISSRIFGAGKANAEIIIKQYLISQILGLKFNSTILYSISNSSYQIAYPLPLIWINILKENNLNVSKIKCLVLFYFYCLKMILNGIGYGCFLLLNSFLKINVKKISNIKNGIVYFDSLTISNISPHRESQNIINWYLQWEEKINNLKYIHHGVNDVDEYSLDNVTVRYYSRTVVVLSSVKRIIKYLFVLFFSSLQSLINLLKGRWWNAAIFHEAAKSLAMKNQDPIFVANQYLFHNSGWLYRPLWTYEAALKGSEIIFYFYSTNCESFQKPNKKFIQANSWQIINWPKYLVWDEFQANFVEKRDIHNPIINITGPIWFSSVPMNLDKLPHNAIAVFDVQPVRDSIYKTLGIDYEYYTAETAIHFLADIYELSAIKNKDVVFKRKREIGKSAHPVYRNFLKTFENSPNIFFLDPNLSPEMIIKNCIGVISMPFTSTALIAKKIGKPTIFYDPLGKVQKNDPAAHSVEIIQGKEELSIWFDKIFSK